MTTFPGVHVACGYYGGIGAAGVSVPLFGRPVWSETMPAPGITQNVAPPFKDDQSGASFEVHAGNADVFVAIGKAPDASQVVGTNDAARIFIAANTTRNFACNRGDKLAWILVPEV